MFSTSCYGCFIHFTGPAPNVTVTATHTAPLYAGSSLTLTCTVTLDPNVDNDETVTTSWSGPSDINGERYLVKEAMDSGSTYSSSLTINFLTNSDDGSYICTGMVTKENKQLVIASGNHTLSITSKTLFQY